MPAGAGGPAWGENQNPFDTYTGGGTQTKDAGLSSFGKLVNSGDFNAAFAQALKDQGVNAATGGQELQDLLNPATLTQAGTTWNTANIDAYYSAIQTNAPALEKQTGSTSNDYGVNQSALGTAYAASNQTGGGEFQGYFNGGGSLNITPAEIASAEASAKTGQAPNALGQLFTPAMTSTGGAFGKVLADVGPVVTKGVDLAVAGGAAAAGAALAAPLGATAAGAASGAAGSVASGTMGGNLTAKGVLTGTALGALGGAVAQSGIGQASNNALTSNGIPAPIAGAVTKGATSALTGAVGGAIKGTGAVSGAEGGALSGSTGAVAGSILSGAGTIFNSGSTVQPTNNPSLTTPAAPAPTNGYNSMGDGIDDLPTFQDPDADPSNPLTFQDPSDPNYNPGNTNLNIQGGGSTLGGDTGNGSSSSNAGLLSQLSKLLGGSTGANSSLLNSLAGILTNGAAGAVNQQAAQYAANQYAGQTQYSPYSVSTNNGTTAFNGTNATSSLSPQAQQTSDALSGLTNSSAASLQAGPQAAQQQYYNQLQASQADANNKMYQNNLDNQFGNGVLSSTAGQYQSQAALANISQQQLNDQTQAANYANTQQQQQLGQLTAGLNGTNALNTQQLAQMQQAGNFGSQASNANLQAFKPLAGANANSNLGNILSSIGNTASNQQTTGGG